EAIVATRLPPHASLGLAKEPVLPPPRRAVALGLITILGRVKCADGSGATAASWPCLARSSAIGPKSNARSGQDSTQIGFFSSATRS
ncbi:hypothetical protein K4G97_23310, partial [Mycobacterium tuberculosis]|nr:hypothetical protein [Mycobacterium tuberculosis]